MANQMVAALNEVSHNVLQTFWDIEEDDEEDQGEEVIQMMDMLGGQARTFDQKEIASDMEVDELEEDLKPWVKEKGKEREREQGADAEETESDWDKYMRFSKVAVKHPSGQCSNPSVAVSNYRILGHLTEDYFDPPCSTCHLAGRVCEQDMKGVSCTQCKENKRACKYANTQTAKQVKSKLTVESEDEERRGQSDSREECQSSPPFNPWTPCPCHVASKWAMQAIRGEIVVPPLQPLVPVARKASTCHHAMVKKSKGKQIRILYTKISD